MTLGNRIEALFHSQLREWELLRNNNAGLKAVICKALDFGNFRLQVQCNPARIRSSAAKIDEKSIQQRPCFLCAANRPAEQQGIDYEPDYTILLNPYPIFPCHLTIVCRQHTDQRIEGRIRDMLSLAKDLPDYMILYNGPHAGASAPDHFHFQAGNKALFPIESDLRTFAGRRTVKETAQGCVYSMDEYLRKTLVFRSDSLEWTAVEFESLLQRLRLFQPDEAEPMINLLASFTDGYWHLFVFPRRQHRPSQYYEEGVKQFLFSPGAVDFGGILIFPRREDFEKITPELTEAMFIQLTFTDLMWNQLLNEYI